jgi:hypothetical protein
MVKLGAVAIHACEIDSYEGGENSGHVVIERNTRDGPRASGLCERLLVQVADDSKQGQPKAFDVSGGEPV